MTVGEAVIASVLFTDKENDIFVSLSKWVRAVGDCSF